MTLTVQFNLDDSSGQQHFEKVAAALRRSRRCVVVTGAGISVAGGIPDFRSADGLYNLVKDKYPTAVAKGKDLFDAHLFKDPTSTCAFYTFMAELRSLTLQAEPTATHKFIKKLDEENKLLRCYTQNIDCLEGRLGMGCGLRDQKGGRIVQLHGDLDNVICTVCKSLFPFEEKFRAGFSGGAPPECPSCVDMEIARVAAGRRPLSVGTLRPNIVLYNEHHSKGDQIASLTTADLKRRPDALLIMGTSLKVHGIKSLVKSLARSVHELKNGIVVFINNSDVGKEWEGVIDYHCLGNTDEVVTRIKQEWQRLEEIDIVRQRVRALKLEEKKNKEVLKDKGNDPTTTAGKSTKVAGKTGTGKKASTGNRKAQAQAQQRPNATDTILRHMKVSKPAVSSLAVKIRKPRLDPNDNIPIHIQSSKARNTATVERGRSKTASVQVNRDRDCTPMKGINDPQPAPVPAPLSPSKRGMKKDGGSPTKKAKVVVDNQDTETQLGLESAAAMEVDPEGILPQPFLEGDLGPDTHEDIEKRKGQSRKGKTAKRTNAREDGILAAFEAKETELPIPTTPTRKAAPSKIPTPKKPAQTQSLLSSTASKPSKPRTTLNSQCAATSGKLIEEFLSQSPAKTKPIPKNKADLKAKVSRDSVQPERRSARLQGKRVSVIGS